MLSLVNRPAVRGGCWTLLSLVVLFPAFVAGAATNARGNADAPAAGRYVPAPKPVDTGLYLLGAIMCPLWQGGKRWVDLVAYPERTPLLGYYDEGSPEVTDWEITWAVDHGISFFLVCWYRAKDNFDEPQVRPVLGHWLHDGLPQSRQGNALRFAIMWENANKSLPVKTSMSDFRDKLVPFWIEQYFQRSNYLLIDGKPVFSIYNADKFVSDLGGEGPAAAALEEMRAACVRAGFKGLHMLGQYCWGAAPALERQSRLIQRLGMDASWAYHWPTFAGVLRGNLRPTGAEILAAQEQLWRAQPPSNIVTVSMGWDSAPWKFSLTKAQWRLTPAEFKTLCARAKALLDERAVDSGELASRVVLIDNWNEFGEGHYIIPTQEHRFGYLDALREVFAPEAPPHRDATPDEIGLGPYDSEFRAWTRANSSSK
jgi:hypothetical protein